MISTEYCRVRIVLVCFSTTNKLSHTKLQLRSLGVFLINVAFYKSFGSSVHKRDPHDIHNLTPSSVFTFLRSIIKMGNESAVMEAIKLFEKRGDHQHRSGEEEPLVERRREVLSVSFSLSLSIKESESGK